MRRYSRTATVGATWEPELPDGSIPVSYDFEVTGTLEPYDPGDRDTPPCGGGVEDIQIELVTVYTDAGPIAAKDYPERKTIEAAYEKFIYSPAGKIDLASIEESLARRAGEYEEPDYD